MVRRKFIREFVRRLSHLVEAPTSVPDTIKTLSTSCATRLRARSKSYYVSDTPILRANQPAKATQRESFLFNVNCDTSHHSDRSGIRPNEITCFKESFLISMSDDPRDLIVTWTRVQSKSLPIFPTVELFEVVFFRLIFEFFESQWSECSILNRGDF